MAEAYKEPPGVIDLDGTTLEGGGQVSLYLI